MGSAPTHPPPHISKQLKQNKIMRVLLILVILFLPYSWLQTYRSYLANRNLLSNIQSLQSEIAKRQSSIRSQKMHPNTIKEKNILGQNQIFDIIHQEAKQANVTVNQYLADSKEENYSFTIIGDFLSVLDFLDALSDQKLIIHELVIQTENQKQGSVSARFIL
jgi:hypothetical protein